jgi:hypothetical protein
VAAGVLEAAEAVMVNLAMVSLRMDEMAVKRLPLVVVGGPMVVAAAVAQVDMYIVEVVVVAPAGQVMLPPVEVVKVG